MANNVYVQRLATRTPADGQAYVKEVLALDYDYDDTGTGLQIPIDATTAAPIFVESVFHIVRTAFAGGTPSVDVGDGADADGWVDTLSITETSAGNVARSSPAANSEAYTAGKLYTSGDNITVTLSASLTAGAATVLADIYRLL